MKKSLVFSTLAVASLVCSVSADNYLVQKKHTDAFSMMGQTVPAKDEQSITWSSADKICLNPDKDTITILRVDKKVMWVIYKKNKKYAEMNLDSLAAMAEKVKTEMAAVPGMGNMMNMSATVTPTTETKQIGKWNCTKYQITTSMPMTTIETTTWTSTDVKIDYEAYTKIKNAASVNLPGFNDMLKEYQKVKGFPVLSESVSKIMGNEVKSTEELVEVSEKAAPAGIYDIPAGFKKTELK